MNSNERKNHSVALLIPPLGKIDKQYLPNIGIGYIAAVLEKAGYEVKIFDSFIEGFNEKMAADAVVNSGVEAVGITATTNSRFRAIETIRLIKAKKPDIFIFVGGRHFHHTAESALMDTSEIDVVVRGEGELTSLELLDKYFSGESINDIKGIAYRDGKTIKINPLFPLISDLDSLPFPAWHLYKLDHYNAGLEGLENSPRSIGVISSRGCPNLCIFCANASFWNTLRLRSPKNFVDEVEMLYKNYGYRAFDFWDDTMTIVPNHILGICEEIIKRKLDIIWYARARVNTVNGKILKKMKEAGCRVISYGVETGSPKILKTIKKNITIEQVLKAYELSLSLGFDTKALFMYSFPGETLEDVKMTNDLIYKLLMIGCKSRQPVHISRNYTLVYPGTEIDRIAEEEGLLPRDFDWNKPTTFSLNEKCGFDSSVPVYQSPTLPLKDIIKFNEQYNKKLSSQLKKLVYHLAIIKNWRDFINFYKLLSRKLGSLIPPKE